MSSLLLNRCLVYRQFPERAMNDALLEPVARVAATCNYDKALDSRTPATPGAQGSPMLSAPCAAPRGRNDSPSARSR